MLLPRGADRILFVEAHGNTADIYALRLRDNTWSIAFTAQGYVGRNGVAFEKREGDGKTPLGLFKLGTGFGLLASRCSSLPYRVLTDDDVWVDDSNSAYYNRWMSNAFSGRDWNSAEQLAGEKTAYRYALVVEYNTQSPVPGAGSAIFVHCSKNKPTAGCISMPEKDMLKVLSFVKPGSCIYIVPSGNAGQDSVQ